MFTTNNRTSTVIKNISVCACVMLLMAACDEEKRHETGVVPHTDATYQQYRRDLDSARARCLAEEQQQSKNDSLQIIIENIIRQK